MMQCKSVISSIVVFFITFVMTVNVVSGYRTTRYHDVKAVIEPDSDSNEIELNSSVFISRLLETSPTALRVSDGQDQEFDEMNQFPHATFSEHTSKPNVPVQPPTSCGEITCDSVPGYPEDIIIEIAKSSKLIPESPKAKSVPKTKVPVARSLDHRHLSNHHHVIEKAQDCSKLVHEIVKHPRESINENDQAKLLVNLPQFNFGPSGRECRGPQACQDPTTPENKYFGCRTEYKHEVVEIFIPDKQQIERQKMLIPSGCKCGLYDLYDA